MIQREYFHRHTQIIADQYRVIVGYTCMCMCMFMCMYNVFSGKILLVEIDQCIQCIP